MTDSAETVLTASRHCRKITENRMVARSVYALLNQVAMGRYVVQPTVLVEKGLVALRAIAIVGGLNPNRS